MKVEWRCVGMGHGGQCVMTDGTIMMPLWFVENLAGQLKVSIKLSYHVHNHICGLIRC